MFNSLGTDLDPKKSKAKYPEARVIVLDDNFNTFQHVANCLLTIILASGYFALDFFGSKTVPSELTIIVFNSLIKLKFHLCSSIEKY